MVSNLIFELPDFGENPNNLVYLKDVYATYLSDSPLYSFCEAVNDNMLHGFQSYI